MSSRLLPYAIVSSPETFRKKMGHSRAVPPDFHPLSIEDMLHNHQTYSSKADYYSKHLFIRLLCHTLADDQHSRPIHAPTGSGINAVPPTPTYTSHPNFTAPPGEDTKFEPVRTSSPSDAPASRARRRTDPVTKEDRTPSSLRPTMDGKLPSRPMMKSIASMALGGAQPWVGKQAHGEHFDPEGAWATSVYPDLVNGLPKQQNSLFTRDYTAQMAGMFITPSVCRNWHCFLQRVTAEVAHVSVIV